MQKPEREPAGAVEARGLRARPPTLRPFQERDLPAVLAIERQVFSNPWSEEAFRPFLEDGSAFSQVALVGRELAGYTLGWCVAPEAELSNLAVDPRWQRRSVGCVLLRWTLETCARRGASEVFLEVRASNGPAQRLYRRHGFEELGRRRNYYGNPREDALVYRARIGGAVGTDDPPMPALPRRGD